MWNPLKKNFSRILYICIVICYELTVKKGFNNFADLDEALDVEIWLEGLNMLDKKLGPDLGEEVGGRQARHDPIRLASSPIGWLLIS
jgi:hypothetical protein